MPDERAAMDRVGRYWDALVLGIDSDSAGLEPDLAGAIQRVHALGATPPATARDRVWREVLGSIEAPQANGGSPTVHAITPDDLEFPGVIGPILPAGPLVRPRHWALAQLATAALLALVLVGSFLIFRPGQLNRQEEPPAYVPAISATPATPETEVQPVAEFLWQSEGSPDLPFGEPSQLAIDPEGNLWVPDGQNDVIQIYAPDGTFLETWGTPGNGEGEFQFTTGAGIGQGAVDFDAEGTIYVADTGNSRIQKFSPDRTFIKSWGGQGSGEGQFLNAIDVAVDQQGRVFVSEGTLGKIEVFDSDGKWLRTLATYGLDAGEVAGPGGLAIDDQGNLWVTEIGSVRAQKFSPDGESLLTIGRRGSGDGEFNTPTAIAVDAEGRVFVADRARNLIQIFSPEGQFLGAWGKSGVEDGQFGGAYGLALDGKGQAYVAEDSSRRVQAFRLLPPFAPEVTAVTASTPEAATDTPAAELLWQSKGDPDLPLGDPTNLAIAPDGNIWVTDGRNSRFQIFAPNGEFLEAWGTPGEAEGELDFVEPTLFGGYGAGSLAFDDDGNLYVADPGNYRIQKFGPDRSFISAWGSNGMGDGQFLAILNLAIDDQGRVYVTDEARGDVQLFDGDGRFLSVWSESAEGWLGKPSVVKIDADGNLWFTHFQKHAVQKYSPDGTLMASWGGLGFEEGQLNNPAGLSIDDEGRVFVSEWANNRIQVFAPDGTPLATWGSTGSAEDQFRGANGLILDGAGRVYVVQDGIDLIKKFRLLPPLGPEMSAVNVAAAEAPKTSAADLLWKTSGGPDTPLSYPGHLAIDPEGNLWVPDTDNSRFQIFSPDGAFLEAWGDPGSGEGQFDFHLEAGDWRDGEAAFDEAGNIYVADFANRRIQKFAPDRSFLLSWGSQGNADGQFLAPQSIAVDGQERVYVADSERNDVQVFDGEGNYLATFGGFGLGEGQFYFYCGSGLAIDPAGNLWVSESCNHRVQSFSPEGDLLATWGRYGLGDGKLNQPKQIAVDREGRVIIADGGHHRVQVFTADGEFLGAWGALGSDPGEFDTPYGIAVGDDGSVYVSDFNEDTVQAFRLLPPLATSEQAVSAIVAAPAPAAEFVWETKGGPGLPFDNKPLAVAVDLEGNLWVVDGARHQFQIFAPDGAYLESWGTPGRGEGQFNFLMRDFGDWSTGDVAFDGEGNLYVADPGNYRILKFGPDRTFIAAWGSQGTGDGQFRWPGRIVIDEAGRVYVSDEMRSDVQVFDSDGTYVETIGAYGQEDGQLNFPVAIARDVAGNIWVADSGHDTMQRFSADGMFQAAWGKSGYGPGDFISITDVAIDGQDRLFVLDGGGERVMVFSPDGTFIGGWGGAGNGPGEFLTPSGIVLDGEGNAYVSDYGNARVQKFRLLPPLAE